MSNNLWDRYNQELEKQVQEQFSKMSQKEIDFKVDNWTKKTIRLAITLSVFALILCSISFPFLFIGYEGEGKIALIIFAILSGIFLSVLPFILILPQLKKSSNELVLDILRKELRSEVVNKIQNEDEQKKLIDSNFIISKAIEFKTGEWSSKKLLIDSQNEKFIYQKGVDYSKIYNFSDLINYEVYENGKSVVAGRAGSALIGGAFFGLGGLIIGSSMSRDIDESCNQLKLIMRINDFDCPQIVVTYIENIGYDKNSFIYKSMKENLQSICSTLEYILNKKTLEQTFSANQEEQSHEKKSNKEQLQELKEMIDEGLITLEDYEQKKKQILGL